MSANSAIEWTDHTFNPWWGCQKVGPGCDHCYAESLDKRTGGEHWGPGAQRRRTSVRNWNDPVRWNKQADAFFAEHGRRQRVFCASMADVFDNAIDPQWRVDLFELIRATPNLDWLLLTKRIGNAQAMIDATISDMDIGHAVDFAAWPYPNVWIGATIVNQEEADRDIPKLLKVPAAVRFLSMEPLLGPVELNGHETVLAMGLFEGQDWLTGRTNQFSSIFGGDTSPWRDREDCDFPQDYQDPRVNWVIVGGESGPGARPMHPDWARDLRDQCEKAGVPFLFKQWGDWCPRGPESLGYPSVDGVPRFRMTDAGGDGQDLGSDGGNEVWMNRAGKKAAGRLLDGRTWDGYPS